MSNLPKGKVKLERALSKLGHASRTEAHKLIVAGKVSVNGIVRNDPNFLVVPEKIKIAIEGKDQSRQSTVVLMLHKPRGVVTTRSDEKGRPTVFSLVSDRKEVLHAVGRLDLATTGLLLLTNDTKFSNFMTDPKNQIERVYLTTVRGEVTAETLEKLRKDAEDIQIRKVSGKETHLTVTLTQGQNREVRRLFLNAGHEVTSLKRVRFGPFELGDLEIGKYRIISNDEFN